MSGRSLPVTRIPSGVTEVEYRRAIQQNRRQSNAASSVDSAALQSELAKIIITVPDTLAQRRGLVPIAPPQAPLTPFDWAVIENSRSDPDSCCPICMEGFKQGHEVLLSCSHIFHRACLRSFENFMKDSEFSCPICRTKNYQKKITHIGSLAFQKVCVLKLQRLFRGYTARKQFRTRLRAFYRATAPGGSTGTAIDAGQKQRRKQYYESEITSISNKLDQNLNKRSNQVDTMLRSMDRTIEESQQLDVLFEQMLASRQQQNQSLAQVQGQLASTQGMLQTQLAAPPLNLHSVIGMSQELKEEYDESAHLEYADECEEYCQESHTLWKDIYNTALKRFPCDCAICMLPVGNVTTNANTNASTNASTNIATAFTPRIPEADNDNIIAKHHKSYANKREIILSCSHVFHAKCIANFERFLRATKTRVCPVCRSEYSKKNFRIV
eukprot:gene7574-9073_t